MKKTLAICAPFAAAILWMSATYECGTLEEVASFESMQLEEANKYDCFHTDRSITIEPNLSDLVYREPIESVSPFLRLDDRDVDHLLLIAESEAAGEGVIGKAMVMRVVLNRVESKEFPDTIQEVINQNNKGIYQFSTVANKSFQQPEVTQEGFEALELVLSGWDESQGATYFCTPKAAGKWHEKNLLFLFQYGNHRFYKDGQIIKT